MAWFSWRQNNSGGYFDGPIVVAVEAGTEAEALVVAKAAGVCDDAAYCECCGTRWSEGYCQEDPTKPPPYGPYSAEEGETCPLLGEWPFFLHKGEAVLYIHADGTREEVML